MEETIKKNQAQGLRPSLLLQVCCGPCSTEVIRRLRDYFDLDLFYYNPNIYPESEFEKRVEVVRDLVDDLDLPAKVFVPENRPEDFYRAVPHRKEDHEGGESCYSCYRLRLEETAKFAKENGYDYFSTTLSVSPYKNSTRLNEIGKDLSEKYAVSYLYSDFKKKNGYKNSITLSQKYGLYRQDYCGCIFSFQEMNAKKAQKS